MIQRNRFNAFRQAGLATAFLLFSASQAFAHHVMGGKMPDTFTAGFLSGIGHPIIGLDHFAFIAGVGIASAFLSGGIVTILAFIGATLAGCGLHLASVDLPAAEIVIAASVLVVGALIMSGRTISTSIAAAIFAIAGLFHGYAYGESIFGAEQTPLLAYLLGFGVIQSTIAVVAMLIARTASSVPALSYRLTGAVIAGIGFTFLYQNVQSIVLPDPAPVTQAPT
ncbi:MAG TPA: HupE/UreJ family protein, partial [Hyphomicrobiales bacterium]|nr:HupE/UreJ family protein [Hyphomicrobiales bacterium]